MKMILRTLFVTMIAMMFASCEFVTNNDLLEQLKKDPPTGTADTDKKDDDTTGNDDLLPDSDELNPDVDTALTCGNGVIEGEEECETNDNIELCADINPSLYSDGEAICDHSNCRWDVSECIGTSLCGTGSAVCSPAEEKECTAIDPDSYVDGYASCNSNCDGWDVTNCVPRCTCGNGIQENFINGCTTAEECDDGNKNSGDGCSSDCMREEMGAIADLTASYPVSKQPDTIAFSWTCVGPGVTNYILKKSRSPITSAAEFDAAEILFNDTASCNPGADRTVDIAMTWYDDLWYVAIRPMRNSTAGPVSAQVEVDTDAKISYSGIGTSIDFGIVGYNATKDITVTLTNASTLVDLYIDEIAIPSGNDCNGKVTITAGSADPGSPVTLMPGATHDIVLRYAPTETSSCSPTDVLDIHYLIGLGPTYTNLTLAILGESKNTPPVITEAYFSPNPVKNADNATVLRVVYEDDNGLCDGTSDIVRAVWDMRELGGGPRDQMWNPSCAGGTHQFWYWKSIDVTTLANGIYVIPFELTDTAGNTVRGKTSFAVYSGNILEVGTDKTYTDINSAVNAASSGDVVVVYPGTYTDSDIKPNGKAFSIYGIEGPENTIIDLDGGFSQSIFSVNSDNGNLYIGGLTIREVINGAIWIGNGTNNQKVTVTNCVFEDNVKNTVGGAIYAAGDKVDLTVTHSQFTGNSANGFSGGAVYATSGAKLFFVDTLFQNNSAKFGGAISLNSCGPVTFDRTLFLNNTSTDNGGAIDINDAINTIEIRNGVFGNNSAGFDGGAILAASPTNGIPVVRIYNNTFRGNSANRGGALMLLKGDHVIKDSIIFYNGSTDGKSSELFVDDTTGISVAIDYSDVQSGSGYILDPGNRINAPNGFVAGANNNIGADPMFLPGTIGLAPYMIASDSPCIDTGSDGSTVPTYDFLGYERQDIAGKGDGAGVEADMGAFEYQP